MCEVMCSPCVAEVIDVGSLFKQMLRYDVQKINGMCARLERGLHVNSTASSIHLEFRDRPPVCSRIRATRCAAQNRHADVEATSKGYKHGRKSGGQLRSAEEI